MIKIVPVDSHHQVILEKPVEFATRPDLSNLRERFKQIIQELNKIPASVTADELIKLMENVQYTFSECISDFCIFSCHKNDLRKISELYMKSVSGNFSNKKKITFISYMPGQMLSDVIVLNDIFEKNKSIEEIDYHQVIMKNQYYDVLIAKPGEENNNSNNLNIMRTSIDYENQIKTFADITKYRYAYFLSLFNKPKCKINLFLHDNLESCSNLEPNFIVGSDYTDEDHSETITFEELVMKCCQKDTVIMNMFKYMSNTRDYFSNKFHLSIKICNQIPEKYIPLSETEDFEIYAKHVHDAYSKINFRTVIEYDTKNKYYNAYLLWTSFRSQAKKIFLGKM